MKSKHIYGVIGVVLVVAGVLLAVRARENDPIYDGKRLSEHLATCSVGGIALQGGMEGMQLREPMEPYLTDPSIPDIARAAILEQGTNAFPMLVRMLASRESRLDRWRRRIVEKHGLPTRFMNANWAVAWKNKTSALAAFHTLGSNAAPATDLIIPLLNHPDTALPAIVALMCIRPEHDDQILSLTNVAGITRTPMAGGPPDMLLSGALLALGSFGQRASNAIPILIESLSSTNDRVQASAAVALARVGAPANQVVPLIINTLPKTDPTPGFGATPGAVSSISETMMKIWALEQYGPQAHEALPMLSQIEGYRMGNLQEAAAQAAAKIKGDIR